MSNCPCWRKRQIGQRVADKTTQNRRTGVRTSQRGPEHRLPGRPQASPYGEIRRRQTAGGDRANDGPVGPLHFDSGHGAAAASGCQAQPVGDVRLVTHKPNIRPPQQQSHGGNAAVASRSPRRRGTPALRGHKGGPRARQVVPQIISAHNRQGIRMALWTRGERGTTILPWRTTEEYQ